MGSCIFSEVTNIFLTEIEKTAVNIFHTPPTLWIRFVDDTCYVRFSNSQIWIVETHSRGWWFSIKN